MAAPRLAMLLIGAVTLSMIPLAVFAQPPAIPAPFKLINTYVPKATLDVWTEVQDQLFTGLRFIGQFNGEGDCNGAARVWWRLFFHDCGTFNKKTRTGGCDASIQFETDRPENGEVTGFAGTLGFYKSVQTLVQTKFPGQPVSMSDIIVLAGYVGAAACQGPRITFTPGRIDTTHPNAAGLLPGPLDKAEVLMASMRRMSFSRKHAVAIITAGHTIANLTAPMDDTPGVFDTVYFDQILGTKPAASGTLFSDKDLLRKKDLRKLFVQYGGDINKWFSDITKAAHKMSYFGQPRSIFTKYRNVAQPDESEVEEYTASDEQEETSAKNERQAGWSKLASKPAIRIVYPLLTL